MHSVGLLFRSLKRFMALGSSPARMARSGPGPGRYFGSKAGLFTAAATAELQVPDLRAVPAGERGELLVRVFVDRWEDAARDDELILLLRTAVTSEAVAAQLQATMGQLVTGPIAALGSDDAAERGAFISAQLLGLALCRYILRLEPLASL